MEEKFTEYLNSIGIPEALNEKIEKIYEFYQEILPEEIKDIFVTDYMKKDGTREYENLWFFSEKYGMEAKQFIIKDDFDITPIQKHVCYWSIEKRDYDFKEAIDNSRLFLHFRLDNRIMGELKASKKNCDYLRDIIIKYIKPNLKD